MKLTDDDVATIRRTSVRRHQLVAAVLLAAAALAFWVASRLTWATVFAEDHLSPNREFTVSGADWSPWLTPLALVLLAAIAAAFSVRGWALRALAILVAACGVLAAFPAISLVTGGADSAYAAQAGDIPDRFQILGIDTNGWVAAVVLIGTVCCVIAGVALLRIANGAAMSSKYQTPAARREELERKIFADHERRKAAATEAAPPPGAGGETTPDSPEPTANERMMWDALDTGIDPTDGAPTDDKN